MRIRYDNSREEIDVGCIYADNCFECPFNDCICQKDEMDIEGEELEQRRAAVREVAKRVQEMREKGMQPSEIAKEMGLPGKLIRKYILVAKATGRKRSNGC